MGDKMIRTVCVMSVSLAMAAFTPSAWGQSLDSSHGAIEITDSANNTSRNAQPRVGRKAAEKYMAPRQPAASGGGGLSASDAHYLALHIGTYVSDTSYKWGDRDKAENVGKWNMGLTYRMGEWVNSMDLAVRVDFSSFSLREGSASKLSFLPIVTFPDARAKFPLYFGGGIGAGVFVNQINGESTLSADYQLLAGARFFDLVNNTGFFIEAGIKNHLFLLSDGQFNGTFAAIGTVFSF